MTRLESIMQILPDDHTSMQVEVDGYPVILRFSATPSPGIYDKIKSLLLDNFTMDKSSVVCDNTFGQEPNCTLKIEDANKKTPHLMRRK